MRLLHFARGKVCVTGLLPEKLRGEATGVALRFGRRIVSGHVSPDGSYAVSMHSRKPVLLIGVWACLADHDQIRVGTRLVINFQPTERSSMLDAAEEYMERHEFLDIAAATPEPRSPADPRSLLIHWIIPDFRAGAGGHRSIFRLAHLLKQRGHRNEFWIIGDCAHSDPSAYIDRHFSRLGSPVHRLCVGEIERIRGDVVIATNCWSAYYARGVRHASRRCYLVQDYEPWFYPVGPDFHLARQTYRFGLDMITAGPWLGHMLRQDGVEPAGCFHFAHDPALYHASEPARNERPLRIAFYARITTDRRMVPLGLRALELLARRRSDLVVHFFGQQAGHGTLPYRHVDEGVLGERELGELYRRCDLGVVFSGTNHSLVPLEMMACGLPVLELEGENNTMVYPADVIALTSAAPEDIAAAIERLLGDPAARAELRRKGLEHTAGLSWETAADVVESVVTGRSGATQRPHRE